MREEGERERKTEREVELVYVAPFGQLTNHHHFHLLISTKKPDLVVVAFFPPQPSTFTPFSDFLQVTTDTIRLPDHGTCQIGC